MTAGSRAFPDITLTLDERRFYNELASTVLRKAVTEYSRCKGFIDPKHWGHVRTRKEISMYRSLRDRADPRVSVIIGSGHIAGTLEDVMDGLYCDTTEDIRRVKTLLGYKSVDGAVLNVTGRREPSDPFRFEGIKWFAAKAPWGVTSMRDLLTFERMGTIVDKHGTEVAYHVVQSIDRSEWPANTVKGMTRTQTSSCYLYRRDKKGLVRCFLYAELHDLTPLTRRVAEYVISGVLLCVTRTIECAQAKRCSQMIAWRRDRVVPASNRCNVCSKSAALFSNSVECAGCTKNACKSCTYLLPIFSIDAKTGEPAEQRFCKSCMTKMISRKISYDLLEPGSVWRAAASPAPERPINTRSASCEEYPSMRTEVHSSRAFSVGNAPLARTVAISSSLPAPRALGAVEARAGAVTVSRSFDSDATLSSSGESFSAGADEDDEGWSEGHDSAAQRRTEGLGEFDLDLDLAAQMESSRGLSGTLTRMHQELVFAPELRCGGDVEKQRFLDDLYGSQRRR